jgi:hypothetical protein
VYTAEWGLVFVRRLKSAGCFLSRIAGLLEAGNYSSDGGTR